MANTAILTVAAVAAMEDGRCKAARDRSRFASLARRDGRYVIECGWAVPEADEDDHLSSTYHPFADGRPCPWVGRQVTTADPAEALAVYESYKDDVWARRVPSRGEKIGSVNR